MSTEKTFWGCLVLVSAEVLFSAGTARASVNRKGFDDTVRESLRELVELSRESQKAVRSAPERIRDLSQRIFIADPAAASKLSHLGPTVEREFLARGSWEEFSEFESSLEKSLNRQGAMSAEGRDRLSTLLGSSVFWHGAQHLYDAGTPAVSRAIASGSELSEPWEKELRGWRAGCVFWEAGMDLNDRTGWFQWPRGFQCGGSLPEVYYCRHHFAVELVLLAAQKLSAQKRTLLDVERSLSRLGELQAYCAEFEHASSGNPLSREGVPSRWSLIQCLENAVATVSSADWRSSLELCPAESKTGPDVRRAAWEVKGWIRRHLD